MEKREQLLRQGAMTNSVTHIIRAHAKLMKAIKKNNATAVCAYLANNWSPTAVALALDDVEHPTPYDTMSVVNSIEGKLKEVVQRDEDHKKTWDWDIIAPAVLQHSANPQWVELLRFWWLRAAHSIDPAKNRLFSQVVASWLCAPPNSHGFAMMSAWLNTPKAIHLCNTDTSVRHMLHTHLGTIPHQCAHIDALVAAGVSLPFGVVHNAANSGDNQACVLAHLATIPSLNIDWLSLAANPTWWNSIHHRAPHSVVQEIVRHIPATAPQNRPTQRLCRFWRAFHGVWDPQTHQYKNIQTDSILKAWTMLLEQSWVERREFFPHINPQSPLTAVLANALSDEEFDQAMSTNVFKECLSLPRVCKHHLHAHAHAPATTRSTKKI